MIPQPLHPVIIHFPIVFSILLPIVAVTALLAIHRGKAVRPGWLPVVALAAALAASSWAAVETGEQDEEIVEEVVDESAIHEHEEGGETFLYLAIAGLALISAGLLPGRYAHLIRYAAVAVALGLSYQGYRVGHSGGELVYSHGAANAHATSSGASALNSERRSRGDPD